MENLNNKIKQYIKANRYIDAEKMLIEYLISYIEKLPETTDTDINKIFHDKEIPKILTKFDEFLQLLIKMNEGEDINDELRQYLNTIEIGEHPEFILKSPEDSKNIRELTNSLLQQYDILIGYLASKQYKKGRKLVGSYMKRVLELSAPRVIDSDKSDFVHTLYQFEHYKGKYSICDFFNKPLDFQTFLFTYDEFFMDDTRAYSSQKYLLKCLSEYIETGESDFELHEEVVDLYPRKKLPELSPEEYLYGFLKNFNMS